MNAKLTLRMDEFLVEKAKREAKQRGKSVSRMIADFLTALGRSDAGEQPLPPVTRSLVGIIRENRLGERDYDRHLERKHS